MRRHPLRALIKVLIEEPDPSIRSAAHRELARRAAAADDLAKAVCHYREAAALDPTDEVAREALDRLSASRASHRRGFFGRIVRGLSAPRALA